MTADELNAIRYLTIGLAKETFKQDYEGFGEEDDDYIREKLVLENYCKGVEDVLKILKNMKQESKWIPVTERLPEEDANVLVTIAKGRHTVMYAKYDRQLQKFCVGNYIRSKYVTAWMPLPESYKEVSE